MERRIYFRYPLVVQSLWGCTKMHLAENEWPTAANVRDKYWLYVVTHCAAELRFLEARQTVARGVNAALVVSGCALGGETLF